MLTVQLYDRNKRQVATLATLTVERYSQDINGGPVDCTLTATGNDAAMEELRNRLGYYVIVRNGNNLPVWWGLLLGVTIDFDGIEIGASLDDMSNSVSVAYTIRDGDGYAVPARTDFVEHDRSVAIYGSKEMLHTIGEASPTQAIAQADLVLAERGLPKQSIRLGRGRGATLRCVGIYDTLRWTYYANAAGREVYNPTTDSEQAFGWGFTASDVGFADRRLHRLSGGLSAPQEGDVIRVSGSTSNNGAWTVESSKEGEVTTYTASTIAFDPTDDINDSAKGLGFVREGTFVEVSGSDSYNGYHLVDGRGRDHITVDETVTGALDTEAAGDPITIEQGESLPLTEDVTIEIPGETVTVAGYTKAAFQFTPTEDLPDWYIVEVWVKVRKIGNPGDSLKVELLADSTGAPGSVIESATVAGSSLTDAFAWVNLTFSRTNALAYGTNYWVAVSRTGANSAGNYYAVAVNEGPGHPGVLKLYDGAAWVNRHVDGAMPFQVWGAVQTTNQIDTILQLEGQYLAGRSVRVASGLYERQYRDGGTDALFNIEQLLGFGTDDGDALYLTISPDWHAIVDIGENSANPPYTLRRGPRLMTAQGHPLQEGLLPVGQWCSVDGFEDDPSGLASVSPFLIGYMEYTAGKGITDIRAQGAKSVFDLGVAQG